MIDLGIKHHFGGGVYAKEALIPAGVIATQHVHKFDHLSVLASGTVVVDVEGVSTEYTGPACLLIEAGKLHSVRAITPAVWFCIHASDVVDPERIDAELVA